MRLVLVRHGDAHAGLTGTIAGPSGCRGLTDHGRRQAAQLRDVWAGAGMDADVLLASVLPRAVETAAIIAPALGFDEVPQDCDLCEVHVGEADASDWADYPGTYGTFDMPAEPDRRFAPGGDSWRSFHERVATTMQRLAEAHAGEVVVAVCHAGWIAASLRVHLSSPPWTPSVRLQPSNTGWTEWEHDPLVDQWRLRVFDDTRHL